MNTSAERTNCPDEVKLLAFFENRLAFFGRRSVKHHLASCSNCCDSLAFLVKNFGSVNDSNASKAFELDADGLRVQTASVIALIERTDRAEASTHARPNAVRGAASILAGKPAFFVSYRVAMAAVVIVLAAAVSIFMLMSDSKSPSERAMSYVASAIKDGRRISAQVPGLPYSQYNGTRGPEELTSETLFERALLRVSPDGSTPERAEDRLAMVNTLIQRAERGDVDRAAMIIEETLRRGPITGEFLNAKGVALLERKEYEAAADAFTSAIEKSPKLIAVYFNRALAEERLNRFNDAKRDLEYYISVETNPEWKKEARERLSELE